jgi:hypothetical protein
MPFSNAGLDMFVSQDLSKLTACHPLPLSIELPDRSEWFSKFILNRAFRNHVPDERAALAFAIIRRADAAVDEWELACEATMRSVRKPAVYFEVLRHFESCVAGLWQGLEFGRRTLKAERLREGDPDGYKLFQRGDGSVYERLNHIYNVSRHYDPSALPQGDLHRVWLSNDGMHTREHHITFEDVREQLLSLARIASAIATGPDLKSS